MKEVIFAYTRGTNSSNYSSPYAPESRRLFTACENRYSLGVL